MKAFYGSLGELIQSLVARVVSMHHPLETTEEAAIMAVKQVDWELEDIRLCYLEARCLGPTEAR